MSMVVAGYFTTWIQNIISIRKRRDYAYVIWQYKSLNIKKIYQSKNNRGEYMLYYLPSVSQKMSLPFSASLHRYVCNSWHLCKYSTLFIYAHKPMYRVGNPCNFVSHDIGFYYEIILLTCDAENIPEII